MEKGKALERAETAYKRLQQGDSFENLVTQFSDDTKSRYSGGDFGYLRIDDQRSAAYFGESFFNGLFNLDQGDVTNVMTSNLGYHIVKITEKRAPLFLELDDPMFPTNPVTVRQYISSGLLQEKQQLILQQAYTELIQELTKEADIARF